MSADEFAILLRDAGSFDALANALKPYAEVFSKPFHTGDRDGTRMLSVQASIGGARFPDDGNSGEELIRRATVALGAAKSCGASRTLIFDESMEPLLDGVFLSAATLNEAISEGQLSVEYQPTVDLASRRIVGAEALVRWDHPERGRLLPEKFVNFAERNGLMGALSRWVLARVVRDVASVRLPHGFRVYINLGAEMLEDFPFIAHLYDTLAADPSLFGHLGIEVTETAAMRNVDRSSDAIANFRRWGLPVAIDDFGTGHSSLSYLKELTVDMVKIDRSFVTALPGDERDATLTEMMLRILHAFGPAALAEGIETEVQASWLLEHGCRFGQGFLFAHPASFGVLLERIADKQFGRLLDR
jgi:EAL domain-containing protein (putative c-di-GMP-specific phosphodiesterase class I)